MVELKEFTKEERLILGLDIIKIYQDRKKEITKAKDKKLKSKLNSLKKQRDKYLEELKS